MVNGLVWASIRQHAGTFVGVFVAVLTATMLATGLGVLVESGIRGGVHAERYAAADVMVGGQQSFDTPEDATVPLNERVPLPAHTLEKLRALPHVARVVTDTTTPLVWAGSPVQAHGWSAAALTPYHLVHGHAPETADQVVVTATADTHTTIGETIELSHGGVPARYEVVGVASAALTDQPTRAEHVFLSDAAASALAPHDGAASVVGVFARPSISPERLADEIDSAVPGVASYTGDQRGNAEFLDVGAARATLVAIGSSFAGTAILIALFVVASTLSLSIQSRRRDFALMRAIGATPLQIIQLVVREVLLIAGAGAVIGAAPGYLLATAMRSGFAQAGVIPADFALAFSPIPAVGAVALVLVSALLAAVVSARRPARINPVEALHEASTTPARLGRGRTITGIVLAIVGVLASALPLFVQGAIAITGPAAALLLLLIAAGLLGPRLVRGAMTVFGGPLRHSSSPAAFLAATNARSNSRRLAAAIIPIALGIGLGLVQVGTGQIVASEATAQSHAGLTADLVVTGGASGVSDDGASVIASVPGVKAANPVALSEVTLSYVLLGDPTSQQYAAQGIDPSTDASTLDLDVVSGSLESLSDAQTVALSTDAAGAAGVRVGGIVHERLGDGTTVTARVVAIYTRGLGFGDVTLAGAALREHTTTGLSDYVLVSAESGQREQVHASLADAGFTVTSRDGLDAVGDSARDANSAVNLIALVVILGYIAIAVVNTLVMATGERRREFALLQLLGATRRQVRSMMRAESIMVAVIAAVLGTLLAAPPLIGISLGISGQPVPGISPLGAVGIIASLSILSLIALAAATWSTMRTAPISEIGSRE